MIVVFHDGEGVGTFNSFHNEMMKNTITHKLVSPVVRTRTRALVRFLRVSGSDMAMVVSFKHRYEYTYTYIYICIRSHVLKINPAKFCTKTIAVIILE